MKRISCALVATMIATALLRPGSAIAQYTFTKTPKPSSGAAPLTVVYTYTFDNTNGNEKLESVSTPIDNKCSPVIFSGGDSNGDSKLDVGEVWTWTCSAVVTTTTMNTAQTSAQINKCYANGLCSTTYLDFITAYATVFIVSEPAPAVGKTFTPELPLKTTIEWGCDWRFAGVCLHRTIVKICIGGHCMDNPAVPGPPVCKVCGVLIGVGTGFALALAGGLLLKKMKGRNIGSGTRFDGRSE